MAEPATNTSFVHPLTQKLHPDADRFGDRATVVGYPGPSPQQGRVRVYLDTTFTSYYELDTRAVLDTVPAKANDENSPTVVVIAASAQVDVVRVDAGQSQARYLEGSITSDYLPAAGTQPWGGQPTGFPCVATVTVGGAADCACILLSAVGNTLAAQPAARADCACVLLTIVGNTLAGQPAARADCVCLLNSIAGTLAGQPAARPDCACVLLSIAGNTLAGQLAARPDCACVLASIVGNTLAEQGAQARGPLCCNPTYTAANCTKTGPTMAGAVPANARGPLCCNPTYTAGNCTRTGPTMAGAVPAWQEEGCIQLGATTICTPTGVQYLCPGNV